MKKTAWIILLMLLTAGWMLLIFGFSAQSGEESGGLSAIIAEPLTELLVRFSGGIKASAREALYLQVDSVVRTAAHFTEYAILGALLALIWRCFGLEKIWLPMLSGAVYALTDEWHQAYIPGRSCEFKDLLVDTGGVICGVLMIAYLIQIWRKKHVQHS